MNYKTTCPHCDKQLVMHVGHPDSAPWVCTDCHHAYWCAELTPEARDLYRPHFRDWGMEGPGNDTAALRAKVHAEREEARARGTSAVPPQGQQ